MPTIHCPTCNQSYDVDPDTIGQKVRCAVCNEKFIANPDDAPAPLKKAVKQSSISVQPQQDPHPQWGINRPQEIIQPECRGVKNRNELIIVLLVIIVVVLLLIVVVPVFFVGMRLSAGNSAKERAYQAYCTSNLKNIGLAAGFYATCYDDWYPTTTRSISNGFRYPTSERTSAPGTWLRGDSGNSFELLRVQDILSDPKGYLCPAKKSVTPAQYNQSLRGHVSYNWCDGLFSSNATMSPIACDGTDNHAQTGRFLRGDGSVGTVVGSRGKSWTQDSSFRDFCYNRTYTDYSF